MERATAWKISKTIQENGVPRQWFMWKSEKLFEL